MKVHHLNCGSMKRPAPMVCHVLLIETDNGLVLVDSGYGTADCADPRRVGPSRYMVRATLSHQETAANQIEQLGYARDDVRHIVITHLDVDHAGGLSDFPNRAGPRHVRRSTRCDQGSVEARENSLPIRAMGTPAQHRRA